MAILNQLLEKKITFNQAVAKSEAWFAALVGKNPAIKADADAALSDFKQAASNAVGLADTAIGPILALGTNTVEASAQAALLAIVGPVAAAELTPGVDATITMAADTLKAAIDSVATNFRAAIVGTPASSSTSTTQPPAS